MAEVFKPYQSIGERFQKTQMPQGLALQEGRRTMAVLSQSMDRMTNFALRQMETKAKIEGAEFGVENAPTLKMLQDANAENTDVFEQFDTSTVFGRAAKDAAITVLENDVYVTATEHINDLVFQATLNGTDPSVLRDSLDSAIMGYEGILSPTAPALAKKLTARLGLSAARQYNTYLTASISSTEKQINSGHIISVNNMIDNVDNEKLNPVFTDGLLTNEIIKNAELGFISHATSIPNVFTAPKLETKIKEWNASVDNWAEETVLNYAMKNSPNEVVKKILNGTPLKDPKYSNLLKLKKFNDPTFRENLVKRIRTEQKARIENVDDTSNSSNKLSKELAKQSQLDFLKLIENPLDQMEWDTAQKHIDIVNKGLGIREGDFLKKMLEDVRFINETERRVLTDKADINVSRILKATSDGSLTFKQLAEHHHLLNMEDYTAAVNAIEGSFDTDFTAAKQILKQLGYDPDGKLLETEGDDRTNYKISQKLYIDGVNKLNSERKKAKKANVDVDLVSIAQTFVDENTTFLKEEVDKILYKSAVNQAEVVVENTQISLKKKKNFDLLETLNFTDNTLSNYKNILNFLVGVQGNVDEANKLGFAFTNPSQIPKQIAVMRNIINTLEPPQ